ncbi:MAG: hypothetical protein ACAI38_20605 [Myxococcota bacterium]|nr:hypothetical protein [Myxococcota bacterium]
MSDAVISRALPRAATATDGESQAAEPQTFEVAAAAIEPIEFRYSFNSGICGVYNEATKRVVWTTEPNGGVTGLYNPNTQRVDWYRAPRQAIAAVRDPQTGNVQTRRNLSGGVAGVVDPATNAPRFEFGRFGEGVGMVVDPATNQVEVNRSRQGPVVGYINPETGRFDFRSASLDGIAVVYRDGDTYRSSCSYVPSPEFPRPDPFPQPPIPPIPIPPRR